MTYGEMLALSNGGAEVLQKDSVLPVSERKIPINLRDTFEPDHEGTMIVAERESDPDEDVIALAGKTGLSVIKIQKANIGKSSDQEKLLSTFASYKIPIQDISIGLNYVNIIAQSASLEGKQQKLMADVRRLSGSDDASLEDKLGLVSLVGQGIEDHSARVKHKIGEALNQANIDVRIIADGSSRKHIAVGIDESKVNEATNILYLTFIG